jgi:hypothetical protein
MWHTSNWIESGLPVACYFCRLFLRHHPSPFFSLVLHLVTQFIVRALRTFSCGTNVLTFPLGSIQHLAVNTTDDKIFAELVDMEYTHSPQTFQGERFRDAAKVAACGIMIGSALLFPLANTEESWFRVATLASFLFSAPSFIVLHLEPFIR